MTATIFYDNINEIALASNTFQSGSPLAPADPTTVACVITDPSGTAVTHTYAGAAPADIVKVSTGLYTLSVPCSPAVAGADGLWGGEWIGTGAVSDVQPFTWRVLPANISQQWYIGPEEFKDRLGITDSSDDFQAQVAIQSASIAINRHCGRHFNRITETRTFQPQNIWLLETDDIVPGSSIQVNLDMQGNGAYTLALTKDVDYQLRYGNQQYNQNVFGEPRPYRQLQIIQTGNWLPFTWPFARMDRVQIITTWGWPVVPSPVVQSCFILAPIIFKFKDAPFGTAGGAEFGMTQLQGNPLLKQLLAPYINGRRKVGML